MSPACQPSFEDIALEDGFAAWTALTRSVGDYWSGALARGATPLDLAREWGHWLEVSTARERPSWSTPHEIVFETPVARLRDFSTAGSRTRVLPTLVLPPQAGHDSCIVDYSPQQSQMRTIPDAGLTRAFTLDWIGASAQTRDATIDDYLGVVDRAVDHVGGRVNLIGDCQGGWLATLYAALFPERINTLTIAGAPIDFHAGEPVIGAVMERMAPGGDLSAYRALVAAGGGTLKGEHMLASFILIKPDDEVARQAQLLANMHDPEHVARYREFEDWFKHTQDIPGAFYLWIVEHLFRDNELVHGELEVGGKRVDLGSICCPLNLLGGAGDHITPPDQVFALAGAAGTPETEVTRRTTSGGHLGLFMGREALSEHWPQLLAGVARYSRPTR
ncbi:MAG TPA: alpha/beta fold hydrolase [Solirubrobacteraceae bacterium]|nr:alpha/beta fold hydrolase [Solirubrobacteraceae bacterium]